MMNVCYNPVTVSRHNHSITTQNNTFTSFDFATSDSDATIAILNEAKQETFFDGITTEEMNLLAINAEEVMAIADSNHFANELGFVQVFDFTCSLGTTLGIMTALGFARVLSFAQALIFANNCNEDVCNADCNNFVITDNKNDDKKSLIYYSCFTNGILSFIANMFIAFNNLETVIENSYSNLSCNTNKHNLIEKSFSKSRYCVITKRNHRIVRLALCHKLVV